MLVRAALRSRSTSSRLERCQLISPYEHQLRWQCSASMRWRRRHYHSSSKQSPSVPVQARQIATVASSSIPQYAPYTTPPDDQWLASTLNGHIFGWKPTELQGSLPMFHNPESMSWRGGIGGNIADLQATLHASIQIGRNDRAAKILSKIGALNPGPIDMMNAHSVYLHGLLTQMMSGNPNVTFSDFSTWYDTKILVNEQAPSVDVLVTMIRAALASLGAEERNNAIGMLLGDAAHHNLEQQVLDETNYTEDEFANLLHMYPDPLDNDNSGDKHLSKSDATEDSNRPEPIQFPDMPELIEVVQKGTGVSSLKEVLRHVSSDETEATFLQQQENLEEKIHEVAVDRWRQLQDDLRSMGHNSAMQKSSLEAYQADWFEKLSSVINEEKKKVKATFKVASSSKDVPEQHINRLLYGPFLELFSTEKLAGITISTVLMAYGAYRKDYTQETTKTAVIQLVDSLFRSLEREHAAEARARTARSKAKPKAGRVKDAYDFIEPKQQRQRLPRLPMFKMVSMLLKNLVQTAMVQVTTKHSTTGEAMTRSEPAFSHVHTYERGKKLGKLAIHESLMNKLKTDASRGSLGGELPMLVEPLPWTGIQNGGYLLYAVGAVRSKTVDETQLNYMRSAARRGDLDLVFSTLDFLGKQPWRINQQTLRVMIEAWNTGDKYGKIPPENLHIPHPEDPGPDADHLAKMKHRYEVRRIENELGGYHSNRCFVNMQLEIAKAFRNSTIYFPHSVDFRGRAYPIPPAFNHMGADPSRSLLLFATGKPLGEAGLKWLKVHLANLYGFDKVSLKEREEFVDQHVEDVIDSATNPMKGKRWWLQAEDPWQCLSACFELKGALDLDDPTTFISHLPIHQDGTCNGLQHYAALGGDEAGAAQVNLEPGDRPADVYTAVADIVIKRLSQQAATGNPFAKILDGKITRKVVKQTVMTNVYGVTFFGAVSQIEKKLMNIFPRSTTVIENGGTTTYQTRHLASHVAKLVFEAMGSLFKGAQALQFWLAECATLVSNSLTSDQISQMEAEVVEATKRSQVGKRLGGTVKSDGKDLSSRMRSPMIWTTPLKMPVVQPYRATKHVFVKTALQTLLFNNHSAGLAVDPRKQVASFPPNFIHSLDASHMMLSAAKCKELGLTFAAVHDSFWTNACDVPTLNTVLRDAFIRMHSEDVAGRLAEELKTRYGSSYVLYKIPYGSDIADVIMAWRAKRRGPDAMTMHIDRNTSTQEAIEEKLRQDLLASEDPEKQAKGRAMVTPASLYEQYTEENPGHTHKMGTRRLDRPQGVEESMDGEISETPLDDMNDMSDVSEEETDENPDETKAFKPTTYQKYLKVQFWLPLKFPPVPERGTFDVTRLRESQYFFS